MPGMAAVVTVEVPLDVNRHVEFSEELVFRGFDYSGATFAAHVRETRDLAGTPWLTFSFSTPALTTEDGLPVTRVTMSAAKGAVDNIPYPNPRGDDVRAWWDLLVNPAGATPELRFAEGPVTIKAGATIP